MSDDRMIDRALSTWLTSGMPSLRAEVVEQALDEAQRTRQRGRLSLAVLGPASWPAQGLSVPGLGRLRWTPLVPAARSLSVLVVIVLLLALLVVAVAGSLLRPPPVFPPFGSNGLIAYSISDMEQRPYNHLHLINADGTDDRELAQATGATFSVDGSTLVYFSGWGFGSDDVRLVVASPDGRNPRAFTMYQQTGFAVSPDGSRVLMRVANGPSDVEPDLSLVTVADGASRVLVAAPEGGRRYWDYRWAPDGSKVAYSVLKEVTRAGNSGSYRERIEIVDVVTGELTVLTTRSGTDSPGLAWAPDSQSLLFTGTPDGIPDPFLGPNGETDGFWPDQDLFAIRVDGTGEVNLTNHPGFVSEPQWASNGSAISYSRWDPGAETYRVFVQAMSGIEPDGSPLAGPPADYAVWSPDAQRLLLLVGGEEGSRLSVVDRDFSEEPVVLVEGRHSLGSVSWQRLDP